LKEPGTKRLKDKYENMPQFCFNLAFKCNVSRYTTQLTAAEQQVELDAQKALISSAVSEAGPDNQS
jgi:hypothetical protein